MEMVYEKRLNTLGELAEELRALDFDGGIRVQGRHAGKPCFIFVTKAGEIFTMAVYSGKRGASGSEIPDRKLMMKEYKEVAPLMKFLEEEAISPFEAYSY
jgi:hypothetical protein